MIEFLTIKVHHGYCPKCAQPVRLRRTYPASGDHYWKIERHLGCSENGKAGTPTKGAKEAFFKRSCLINENAELKRRSKKTGKSRRKILPHESGFQFDLFQMPVAP